MRFKESIIIKERIEYLHWKIDNCNPTTDKFMLEYYSKYGIINKGRKIDDLPNFETWKKLKL